MWTKLTTDSRRTWLAWRSLTAVALFAAAVTVCGSAPSTFAKVFSGDSTDDSTLADTGENQRLREGTHVEKFAGHFKLTGDRVTFIADKGSQRFGGLENLALERVARTVKDSPAKLQWVVSGVITEYRGTNYLLVTHAMLSDEHKELVGR
jgi:hypothetical protein